MPLPKPHLSMSQITQYLRCPACYKWKYVDKIKPPLSPGMLRGRAVHNGIEFNSRVKMVRGTEATDDDLQDVVSTSFHQLAPETDFQNEDPGKTLDSSIDLAYLYKREVSPQIMPWQVEQQYEIAFEDLDYTLMGYLDLITDDGTIIDFKTTKQRPSQHVLEGNIQLACYALMYRTVHEEPETGVSFHYLVSKKTPEVVSLQKQVLEEDINRFLLLMQKVVEGIEAGLYFPNPTCYQCGTPKGPFWEYNRKGLWIA